MRMLCPCLCRRRSIEDLELVSGKTVAGDAGCSESRVLKLMWTRLGFVPGNDAKAETD